MSIKNYQPMLKELYAAILSLETESEVELFLEDLCTIKELQDMAQRLDTAILLAQGVSYQKIAEQVDESPAGLWLDVCAQMRSELKPPVSGFFAANGPIQGILKGNTFLLLCANDFAKTVVDKPEILDMVARKVSAKLGRQVRAMAADKNNARSQQMEQLLQFGRDHADVINIKNH